MVNWLYFVFNEYVAFIISSVITLISIYLVTAFMFRNSPKIIFNNNQDNTLDDGLTQIEREKKELMEKYHFEEEEIKEYIYVRQLGATPHQSIKLLYLFGNQRKHYKEKLEKYYKKEQVLEVVESA